MEDEKHEITAGNKFIIVRTTSKVYYSVLAQSLNNIKHFPSFFSMKFSLVIIITSSSMSNPISNKSASSGLVEKNCPLFSNFIYKSK